MEYKHRDTVLIVDGELLDALYGVVDAVAKDQTAKCTTYAKEFRNLIKVQDSHNPEPCKNVPMRSSWFNSASKPRN